MIACFHVEYSTLLPVCNYQSCSSAGHIFFTGCRTGLRLASHHFLLYWLFAYCLRWGVFSAFRLSLHNSKQSLRSLEVESHPTRSVIATPIWHVLSCVYMIAELLATRWPRCAELEANIGSMEPSSHLCCIFMSCMSNSIFFHFTKALLACRHLCCSCTR